jgi:hypothetical protein
MLFVQTTAPVGWTKVTTHNNKALRVVSGTAGSGGSVAFTTAFASQSVTGTTDSTATSGSVSVGGSVGSTTLDTSQIPSHTHAVNSYEVKYPAPGVGDFAVFSAIGTPQNSQATGGGGSHTHSFSGSGSFSGSSHTHTFTGTSINLAVQYVDIIIATKD